jgi:sterol desaturase/sphingolipid hydroxylase (fatty acid hydroxylase superfamily)
LHQAFLLCCPVNFRHSVIISCILKCPVCCQPTLLSHSHGHPVKSCLSSLLSAHITLSFTWTPSQILSVQSAVSTHYCLVHMDTQSNLVCPVCCQPTLLSSPRGHPVKSCLSSLLSAHITLSFTWTPSQIVSVQSAVSPHYSLVHMDTQSNLVTLLSS